MKWLLFALVLPPLGDGVPDRTFSAYDSAEQWQIAKANWGATGPDWINLDIAGD